MPIGYTFLTKTRNDRNGGGVDIICRNDWKIMKLGFPHNAFECLWVEISPVKDQHFMLQ